MTEKERRKMVNIISRNPNLSSIKIQAWSGSTTKTSGGSSLGVHKELETDSKPNY